MARRPVARWSTIRQVLCDTQRKPLPKLLWEAARFSVHKRELPRQYFRSMLYRQPVSDPLSYLTHRQYRRLRALVDRPEGAAIFGDKLSFHEHFHGVEGIRLPRHLGHTEGDVLHTATGHAHPVDSAEAFTRALDTLLGEVSPGPGSLFAKPRSDYGGRGVFKVGGVEEAPALWEAVRARGYVFQQTVEQHPALNAVYPHSLNTLRIATCQLDGRPPVVGTVRIRFGHGGRVVDNGSAGGFYGGVDPETGAIFRFCTCPFGQGGHTYTHHPDTSHPLVEFIIPYLQEALEMVLAAARHLPYPLVGWDVSIAPDGPVLIEGNSSPDYHDDEVANMGYLTHPVLGPFIHALSGGRGLGPDRARSGDGTPSSP